MQIHELTFKKKTQIDEGLGDLAKGAASKVGGLASKVAGGVAKAKGAVSDIKGAYQGARMDQQVSATADKAYKAWSTYKQQLDKYYADSGQPAPAGTYEKALMAFVQKNLLGGAYIPNLTNKDEIVGLVKKIAGDGASTTTPPAAPPAGAEKSADATAATAPAATKEIPKDSEVAIGNEHYRWLGAQWALVNPKTGKAGQTAPKGIQDELNKQAAAGKFATPFVDPATGNLSPEQQAANKAKGKADAPYGYDTKTGKPLPKPTTTGAGARMGPAPSTPGGAGTTTPATPTDEPIFVGGKKLDPKFPGDAKTIAALKASGQLNEYADLEKKLREAVYKAKADNPNAKDQNPYVQGRAGDGPNPGQFAKFDPSTSTTANASAGINAMAAGGQAARDAEKPAQTNPAQEKQLFTQLVRAAALSNTTAATGEPSGGTAPGGGATSTSKKQVQDPRQMVGDVEAAVAPQVDPSKLKAAGSAIRQKFQLDPSIDSTEDDAVDALLISMGFQPA